jgi:hypothetical protein
MHCNFKYTTALIKKQALKLRSFFLSIFYTRYKPAFQLPGIKQLQSAKALQNFGRGIKTTALL